jgi:SnoaL-like domain
VSSAADDLAAIGQVIYRYSHAMDTKNWALMDSVFLPDAQIVLGDMVFADRARGVAAIRAFIECCSLTHHMNSNITATITADRAHVRNYFRASHKGVGPQAEQVLEAMGTYDDEFVRTSEGWRIARRVEASPIMLGDMSIFAAALPAVQKLLGRA